MGVWLVALHERFERRGAYFVPHGAIDWDDPAHGARYVPELHSDVHDAWVPGDELFVPCRHSDGHLLGIISVGEPISGKRPSDEQLDLLVAMASLAAHALQSAQEAVEAARHRTALEQLFTISSRLPETARPTRCSRPSATASPARWTSCASASSSSTRSAACSRPARRRAGA